MMRELCRGKSYVSRIAFTQVAYHILQRFSSRYVKDFVFDLCLELLFDPVPNVRLSAANLLPLLKHCVRLPEDVELLEKLNTGMSAVITDNDRDVSQVRGSYSPRLRWACCFVVPLSHISLPPPRWYSLLSLFLTPPPSWCSLSFGLLKLKLLPPDVMM
jgi:hypothetical protein